MGYSKKELKMYIRCLKKTIKTLTKMDKWTWNPLVSLFSCTYFSTINYLKEQLKYYQGHLNDLKKGL